jgi:hypothetical protein
MKRYNFKLTEIMFILETALYLDCIGRLHYLHAMKPVHF